MTYGTRWVSVQTTCPQNFNKNQSLVHSCIRYCCLTWLNYSPFTMIYPSSQINLIYPNFIHTIITYKFTKLTLLFCGFLCFLNFARVLAWTSRGPRVMYVHPACVVEIWCSVWLSGHWLSLVTGHSVLVPDRGRCN